MISELVKWYCLRLETLNRSPSTVKIAYKALDEFTLFLSRRGVEDVRELSDRDFEDYALYLRERKRIDNRLPVSTVHKNRMLHHAKAFIDFLVDEESIMMPVGQNVGYFKEEEGLPRDVLSEDEVKRFFEAITRGTEHMKRDYCFFRLLYHTGIRKGEAQALRLGDINFEDRMISVTGKGKTRIVPLGDSITKILINYINNVRPGFIKSNPGCDIVFVTQNGGPYRKNLANSLCRHYADRANIEKKVTAHTFRHTFATHLIQNGASIRHVQEILGHECLKTTETYTKLTISDLKEVYTRCHPRCKK